MDLPIGWKPILPLRSTSVPAAFLAPAINRLHTRALRSHVVLDRTAEPPQAGQEGIQSQDLLADPERRLCSQGLVQQIAQCAVAVALAGVTALAALQPAAARSLPPAQILMAEQPSTSAASDSSHCRSPADSALPPALSSRNAAHSSASDSSEQEALLVSSSSTSGSVECSSDSSRDAFSHRGPDSRWAGTPTGAGWDAAPSSGGVAAHAQTDAAVGDVSSVGKLEDQLLEVVRQVEAKLSSAVGSVSNIMPSMPSTQSAGSEAATAASEDAKELVKEVWEVVNDNYLDARKGGFDKDRWRALRDQILAQPLKDTASAHRAIVDMLARGLSDPYTRFITPQEFQEMRKYDVTGVGLNLGPAEEFTRKTGLPLPAGHENGQDGIFVMGMINGSAADVAGLEQGDEVLEVDGTPVAARSAFQVAGLLQGQDKKGPPSPSVTIKVRKPDGAIAQVAVKRQVRTVTSPVIAYMEEKGARKVGYVKLASFNARAQQDVVAAVKQLQQGGADEFVLDLRDNRGGLVNEGIEVAKLFLQDNATVVITEGLTPTPGRAVKAPGPALTRAPLTVLVNEHSASASEILAGALHDNCRAVLVGTRTYGKGLIQSVYELHDSSGLALTVGKYLTPALTDIDLEGIQPDFRHPPSQEAASTKLAACTVPRR